MLIGDEAILPYERITLSKEILQGTAEFASSQIFDEAFYRAQNIDLSLGTSVTNLDVRAKRLKLGGNGQVTYDKLIFATGARARQLKLPGLSQGRILTLRNIADAERLKFALELNCRVAILGGGFIGLEVAASATRRGCSVTVIEARPRLLEADI